jgi:hypothetical protein
LAGVLPCPIFDKPHVGARRRCVCNQPLSLVPDPLAGLQRYPELTTSTTFEIWNEDSDPTRCGMLAVTLGPAGLEIRWLGAPGSPLWSGPWTEALATFDYVAADLAAQENAKRTERRRRREWEAEVDERVAKRRRAELVAGNIASIRVVTCSEDENPPTGTDHQPAAPATDPPAGADAPSPVGERP